MTKDRFGVGHPPKTVTLTSRESGFRFVPGSQEKTEGSVVVLFYAVHVQEGREKEHHS